MVLVLWWWWPRRLFSCWGLHMVQSFVCYMVSYHIKHCTVRDLSLSAVLDKLYKTLQIKTGQHALYCLTQKKTMCRLWNASMQFATYAFWYFFNTLWKKYYRWKDSSMRYAVWQVREINTKGKCMSALHFPVKHCAAWHIWYDIL